MTDVYEFSELDRKNLIYSFADMTAEEIETARKSSKAMKRIRPAKRRQQPQTAAAPLAGQSDIAAICTDGCAEAAGREK